MKKGKEGSIILLVLVLAVVSGLLLTSLSQLAITESRINEDARLVIEAKEAAEAVVECGFAQLTYRFKTRTSFPPNSLSPKEGSPLVLTEDFFSLFASGDKMTRTRVLLAGNPYDAGAKWGSQTTELIGGVVSEGEWKFIDSRIPGNEMDELRDKIVFVREVEVLGKATVEDLMDGRQYTSFIGQQLQVRDAPLFAHAVFYNMDMEIAPGADMDIRGSVHANGRLFVQSNRSLDFYGNVSATGQFFHGRHPGINESDSGGEVTFKSGEGDQLSMKSDGDWLDSNKSDFQSIAKNRWDGNLLSYEHGVQKQNPVAIEDYEADDFWTWENEMRNHAYQLIQPIRNNNTVSAEEMEVEKQKFAYKAGLVIHVEVPELQKVVEDLKDPDYGDVDVQEKFFEISGAGKDPEDQPITVYRYDYSQDYESIDFNQDGTPKIDPFNKLDVDEHFLRVFPYKDSGSTVVSGLYDQRMSEGLGLIEIDIGKLKEAVEENDKDYWGNAGKAGNNPSALPQNWWNGIVYIQVSTVGDPGRPDKVIPAKEGWAVKVVNGGDIPNPDFGWAKDLYGMTIATNAPMYVHGNYNADGNKNTGSATTPDSNDVRVEPPAALIADAVTILSDNWDDADSKKSLSNRKSSSFTEVAAAILTGIVPSDKNNNNTYSGGVENFPRFLEAWKTLRYRGSMVSLFESEIATSKWPGTGKVYSPPIRDWGFNTLFARGYYPPGTPNTRTFRRINYRDLTEAEYLQAANSLAAEME